MRRRALLSALGTIGAAGTAGCLLRMTDAGEPYDVGMSANAYEPYRLEVSPGTEVVWLNDGSRAHTVTAFEGAVPEGADFFATGGYETETAAREAWHEYRGGNIYSGERYTHVFEEPGRYPYFCVPHEPGGMMGEIYVRD